MPTIPTYDGPQLRQQGVPDAYQQNQDISSGGNKLAQGLGAAAEAVDKIGLQQDTMAAQEAETTIRSAWFKKDQELRTQFSGTKIGGYQGAVDAWWAEAPKAFGENLNGRAQMIASRSLVAAQDMAQRTAAHYSGAETARVQGEAFVSAKQQVLQDTLTATAQGNMAAAPVAIDDIKTKNAQWAALHNQTPEELKMQNVKDLTALHANVISQLLVKDPKAAQAYWDDVDKKTDFDATKIDEINNRLKSGVAAQVGGEGGREVFKSFMDGKGYNDAVPEDKMDAELVKRYGDDTTKLAAARQELNYQVGLFNKTQTEQQAGAVNGVYKQINAKVPMSIIQRTPEWAALSSKSQLAITQEISDRNHMLSARSDEDILRAERMRTFRTAPALLAMSDPTVLANLTRDQIMANMPSMGEANTAQLMQRWQSFQGNQVKLSEAKVDNDMFESIAAAAGIDPKPKQTDKNASAQVWNLRQQVEQAIGQRQQQGGRELSRADKSAMMTDIIHQEVIKPSWIPFMEGDAVPGATLNPKDLAASSVKIQVQSAKGLTDKVLPLSSIPTDEYAATQKYLRERGQPDDPKSVAARWYRAKNK